MISFISFLVFPALSIAYLVFKLFRCGSEIPSHLPWVGQDAKGPFKRARSYLRSIFGTKAMLEEGYEKYSRHGQAFVLPNLFTGAEILLPPSYFDWLHDQPETHFSGLEAHKQFMRGDYTLLHPLMCSEHVFEDAIKKHLTRGLDSLLPTMASEVEVAVTKNAGSDINSWREMDGFRSWKMMMVQTVSSIYVGRPLCRDETYLYYASRFNQMVIFNAGIIGAIPKLLRPLLAPLVVLPDKLRHRNIAKLASPLISQRLEQVQRIAASEKPDYSPLPHDLLTWAARDAVESSPSARVAGEKASVDFLARRLSVMTFVSTDSTTITLGNVLFDILLSDADGTTAGLMARVQDEVKRAYDAYRAADPAAPAAAKTFIESLPLLDACLKESFRLRNFISRGLVKTATGRAAETAVPGGVGVVPAGVKVGIPVWGIHHDEALYGADATTWRAERWLGGDNDAMQTTPVTGGGSAGMPRRYAPFGYKRFACPGRFYAVRLVKLILAYTLLHYEIKLAGEKRPVHYWWGISVSPPREAGLLVRRKNVDYEMPFLS